MSSRGSSSSSKKQGTTSSGSGKRKSTESKLSESEELLKDLRAEIKKRYEHFVQVTHGTRKLTRAQRIMLRSVEYMKQRQRGAGRDPAAVDEKEISDMLKSLKL